MPQVSSIWMIRAGDGHQPRIIQRAGIRQAAMPGTPRGASRHGSGHPGSGGCGCPERPLPPFRHHAERRSRSGRTRTLPPFCTGTIPSARSTRGAQNGIFCRAGYLPANVRRSSAAQFCSAWPRQELQQSAESPHRPQSGSNCDFNDDNTHGAPATGDRKPCLDWPASDQRLRSPRLGAPERSWSLPSCSQTQTPP